MLKPFVIVSLALAAIECKSDMTFSAINCLYDNAYMTLGDTCQLPESQEGVCSELIKCESAKKLFTMRKAQLIQHCGFSGNQRLVCCPRSKRFTSALCKTGVPQGLTGPYFKIVNGDEASPGEFPFQAALGKKSLDGEILFSCGGSLVADNVLLTAAHCFNKDTTAPTMARLGRISLNLADTIDENEAVDIDIQAVRVHPQYNSRSRHHDIALIKLKSPVKFTTEIKPVCLSSSDSGVPKNLTISGYGSTAPGRSTKSALSERLLKGIVQHYSYEECKKAYKASGRDLIDSQYCANSYSGIDACQGDSGGPLSYEHTDGAYYQYGVISYGASCGGEFPAIYTKVNRYLDWIGDEMLKFESSQ